LKTYWCTKFKVFTNNLADIFLPSYIKNKDSVSDITEFKEKCEGFCKKNKQVLCDDLSLNIELIEYRLKVKLTIYAILNCCQSMFAHYMYFLPLYNLVMLFEEGTSQNILDDTFTFAHKICEN
jgi:hypothetical protein